MNKEIKIIEQKIRPILRKFKVSRAGIFGSYARGENTSRSDIDVLVKMGSDVDLIKLIQLRDQLQKKTGKKVDLVEYQAIRKELRDTILKEEISLTL